MAAQITVGELELFFSRPLPKELQISPCERSTDLRKTVDAHMRYLKANKGNKLFKPYYNRLVIIYQKLSHDTTTQH